MTFIACHFFSAKAVCVALHASHFFLQSQTAFPELKVLLIKLSDGLFYETKLEIRADFGWSGLVGQNEVMNFWYLLTGWQSMMLFFGAYFPGPSDGLKIRGCQQQLGGHNLTNKCAKLRQHFTNLKMHCTHAHCKFQVKGSRTHTTCTSQLLCCSHKSFLS